MFSIQLTWWSHGAFEREGTDVLPLLFEQGHEEVDRRDGVEGQLSGFHLDMADGDAECEHLFHLELDGRLEVVDLGAHVVVVSEETWELASLVETRAQDTWDLLDESSGRKESCTGQDALCEQYAVVRDDFAQAVYLQPCHSISQLLCHELATS